MLYGSDSKLEAANGLKRAMRRMPSAVALITTHDPQIGQHAGLVASAVIPVSMDPPSMLISINRNASAHQAIVRAERFCINLLSIEQDMVVSLFTNAERRAERFEGDSWAKLADIPYLPQAYANIFCEVRETIKFGTHEVFIGEVSNVREEGLSVSPLCWIEGDFARAGPLQRGAVS